MKKKIIAAFAASAVLLASGCSGGEPAQTTAAAQDSAPEQTTTAADTSPADTGNDGPAAESTDDGAGAEDSAASEKKVSGFAMKVNGSDGKMSITRAPKKSSAMGGADTWTIFVYLCGTDLESGGGAATSDIMQMLEAEGSDNVRFVIQTGGTSEWMNEVFSAGEAERYVVQNQDIQLADSVSLTNMGDPATLEDFLSWGVENYPAEKMGVVFWDHGGGSITGACFDELNEGNSLSLSEINTALSRVYANMTDKFEFIGFDCCLMGTAETANVLATYARYFYGSQETEPGSGWDYTAYGAFLAQNPSADGAQLGKVITDSFYDECAAAGQESDCTFTIIDLEKFDDFTIAFNDYAQQLYNAGLSDLAGIVRGVNGADNFGGNNKSEGYTNMVDIGGILSNCSAYADGSAVKKALDNCIVYNKNGVDHKNASGLSVYYPLQLQGSNELGIFSGVCISPYYLSLVDMIAKGYSDNGYTNEVFFTEDGDWYSEDGNAEGYDESYFDYAGEGGGEKSQLITFEIEPTITDDGIYGFQLDESGLEYTSSVVAYIYMSLDDENLLELGETFDVLADWDNGIFTDNFDGYWLSLPNGQLLATYIVGDDDESCVYTAPIILNGERTNLRIVQTDDDVYIEGAWDGIDENGMASREIKQLKAGDSIAPIYYIYDDSDNEQEYIADEYEWSDGDNIVYSSLPEADYHYGFGIDDIYGDYYISDFVVFSIDDNGNISFDE